MFLPPRVLLELGPAGCEEEVQQHGSAAYTVHQQGQGSMATCEQGLHTLRSHETRQNRRLNLTEALITHKDAT